MEKDINELNPDERIKILKELINKKNKELALEKAELEKAKEEKKKIITEAIIKREKEFKEDFSNKDDESDISDILIKNDETLEAKLFGLKQEDEELSSYLSSKSSTENIYNDLKVLYTEAQNGGVSPMMAELAGNMQYALQQKYEDVKSGNYRAGQNVADQANIANKIAHDILSLYTGTKNNENLRRY